MHKLTLPAGRSAAGISLVVALATALSACGSGGSSNDAAAATGTFTGDPIKVMVIAPKDTQVVSFQADTIAQAFAKQVNADKGIAGHRLDIVFCNDKFDPNEAANCARQAISQKVVAVVGGFTAFGDSVMPALEQANIPYLGNSAVSAAEVSSKYSFPIQAGPVGFPALGMIAAKDCGSVTAAIIDTPAAGGILDFVKGPLAAASKSVQSPVKVAPTTVDYSSTAKALDGFDCAITALSSTQIAPLVASMAQLGVKTKLLTPAGAIDAKLLEQFGAQLDGSYTLSTFPVYESAAWDSARKALGDIDMTNAVDQNTWVSFVVFQQVLQATTGPLTSSTVYDSLNGAKAVDTSGLTPTLDLTKGLPVPGLARILNPTVVNLKISDGKLVQQGDFQNLGAALGG